MKIKAMEWKHRKTQKKIRFRIIGKGNKKNAQVQARKKVLRSSLSKNKASRMKEILSQPSAQDISGKNRYKWE